jgi:hypothetical protein
MRSGAIGRESAQCHMLKRATRATPDVASQLRHAGGEHLETSYITT